MSRAAQTGEARSRWPSRTISEVREMGVILVGVSVGAALDRLLSPHPVWPFSVTILLGVVAMVGGVLWAL